MTFLPCSIQNDSRCCCCGAALSKEAHPRGLSCGRDGALGCPVCDDPPLLATSGSRSDVDPTFGVIVAHTNYVGPSRGEICLLPFRVSPITSRLAWSPSEIVLVGRREAPCGEQARRELEPLDAIEGCRVHIDRASSRAALVRDRLRVDLVVGVDESSWEVIARLPVPDGADVAILADDVPWTELYGRPFAPLDTWWWNAAPGGVHSTLRLAALMGHILDLGAPSEGLSPIEHLMCKFESPDLIPHVHPHEEVRHVRA